MTPLRRLLPILLLSACGGGGGPSDDPGGGGVVVALQKPMASGDGQTGVVGDTLAAPIVVLVTEDGAPSAGRVVAFTPLGSAGTLVPAADTTGADGLASARWILGTAAGSRQVRASLSGASGSPLTFTATATPGPAIAMTATGGQSQSEEAGGQFGQALVVRVVDAFGNGVANVAVAWAVTAGSATLSATNTTTGATGSAAVTVQAGDTAGGLTVTATTAGLQGSPVEFQLTVTPAATHISVASNFFSPASVSIPVGDRVVWDWANGTHNVTPDVVSATFPASGDLSGNATFGPILFDVAGVYTYQCTIHSGMTGTITVGPANAPRPGVQR